MRLLECSVNIDVTKFGFSIPLLSRKKYYFDYGSINRVCKPSPFTYEIFPIGNLYLGHRIYALFIIMHYAEFMHEWLHMCNRAGADVISFLYFYIKRKSYSFLYQNLI